jgi:tight adherence protein B
MALTSPAAWLRALAVLTLGISVPMLGYAAFASYRAQLEARVAHYEQELACDLTFLRAGVSARKVVLVQASALVCSVLSCAWSAWLFASLAFTLALVVQPIVRARRARRTGELELQLDSFLRGLAASLRATPALGDALEHCISLVATPLRDELDHLVKELKLGAGLDEALARMGQRVQSRTLESALATLRIGRSTGGDLPNVLERAASTLREMARLEGVLRTKTAEGKAQTFVLALTPFPLFGLLQLMNPGFLAPLFTSTRGHLVLACAFTSWLSSLLLARRILRVDL